MKGKFPQAEIFDSNKKGKFPPWRKFTFIFREAKTIIRAWRDYHSA
jgi:hypothetical protein